ncbi:MAG TPA: DUF4965 domain-containing protein [Phycisphaerae bacterium]|nr:DUF4965 domain-containing protein [Phycisphaerae bacterium]
MPGRFPVWTACIVLFGTMMLAGGRAGGQPVGPERDQPSGFRPPSVPLVTHDPYFSVWSPADRLTDAATVHWTGKRHALTGMVVVDDDVYRLVGPDPQGVPTMEQTGLTVLPTRTIYTFRSPQVKLALTFMSPLLPSDLDLMSRPVTYVTCNVQSADGKPHRVSVRFDVSGEWTVNTPDQAVTWSEASVPGLSAVRMGSVEQRILARKGDDLRIEWGYLYLAAPRAASTTVELVSGPAGRLRFTGARVPLPQLDAPLPAADAPVMACTFDYGEVGAEPVSRYLMLAYDDLYSIRYFGKRLRPYWRRNGAEAADILQAAQQDYAELVRRCERFDRELMSDMTRLGGEKYAQIGALAYRQCLAANKIVADSNGLPLMFSKENFSNGCIGTVDIAYPMSPQLLLTSPTLMKATLVPVLDYASSPRWKWPFAPHDLGTYPFAEGQVYGGGERTEENQMPVEESGNMLLLLAAVAKIDGTADFAARYWPVITRWAEYLVSKGFDPDKQLCTDDFAGHLAHNVNLSAKAILGIAGYAMLAEMQGKQDVAARFRKTAEDFAARWMKEAADGDHYRLAFDKPGTWSQKYNLVWDRVLGLNLFPAEVVRGEVAYYRKMQNRYGLPLDNRDTYTKLDWILWSAVLTGSPEDFDALVAPVWDFLNVTPDRVPMTDWYRTTDARKVGFQARAVVGGVFMRLLDDMAVWKKWAAAAERIQGDWAPLPEPPKVHHIVPTAREQETRWRFTLTRPADGWYAVGFDDSKWREGVAGFGTRGTPGATVRTRWNQPEIWLRREIELKDTRISEPRLLIHHDEDAEVYINGKLAAKLSGYTTDYEIVEISPEALAALKPGRNLLAVHCRQTGGGQYIDVGLVSVTGD